MIDNNSATTNTLSQDSAISPKRMYLNKKRENAVLSYASNKSSFYGKQPLNEKTLGSGENNEKLSLNAESNPEVVLSKAVLSTLNSVTGKINFQSNNQILNELRKSSLSYSITAQQLANDYNISISRAKEILEELRSNKNLLLNGQVVNVKNEIIQAKLSNPYEYSLIELKNNPNTTMIYSI